MKTFISEVIADVIEHHDKFENLIFVLPSQRACVFLKQELITQLEEHTILPKIISIEGYIQELADIDLIDQTQLLFEFYKIYKDLLPEKDVESFETFTQWASIALHDFNEIDSYFIDQKAIFGTLRDIKRLNKWFQGTPSEMAIKHLQFFEHLEQLHQNLYDSLKANKTGYQGLIYKEGRDNLEYYINSNAEKHIVFAGFNALNKAEEYIFQQLLDHDLASVYWDAPESILSNNSVAGSFLRKYKKEWNYYKNNPFKWVHSRASESKVIHLTGAPKNITQIKYVGELLSNLSNFDRTALVLADENLLPLALNSLPDNVKRLNITMGYPLKDVPLGSLFDQLFRLLLNQKKFKKSKADVWYYKDVIAIFNNPYLNKLYAEVAQKIITTAKKTNSVFITTETIKGYIKKEEIEELEPVFSFFAPCDDMYLLLAKCIKLIDLLKDHVSGIEKEYMFRFYQVFQQLISLNKTYGHIQDLKTLSLFFNQIVRDEKLSFEGEPLEGLQLMGMLETRVLDFETVIITSMNEGILPKGKNEISFIPFDVKKHFELPTYQEKDAIFSYHFYRLLQRASNIYLLYNTETDGYGSGEKSRFLTEMKMLNPGISSKIIGPVLQEDIITPIEIEKTPKIIEILKEKFSKGISPSALGTYIRNPLKFYEQVVLGIREENEIEETIAANTMGSVIHEVLEEMYKPFVGKELAIEEVRDMIKLIDPLLNKYFEKNYQKGNIKTGKNKLIYEVSKNHLNRFLKQEQKLLESGNHLRLIGVEPLLQSKIKLKTIDLEVNFKGYVDRIDMMNDRIRIIDYKTGLVKSSDLKIKELTSVISNPNHTKALQVLMYSYLFRDNYQKYSESPLETGIISFKNLKSGFIKLEIKGETSEYIKEISSDHLELFTEVLETLIVEILNPEIPFLEVV